MAVAPHLLAEHASHPAHLGVRLFEDGEVLADPVDPPYGHDHERLEEQPV